MINLQELIHLLYQQESMVPDDKFWFTYEPIPHTDNGLIFCDGSVQFTAKVTRSDYGKKFTIQYDGQANEEIDSILKKMHSWFFYTHVKDAEDNEF